MASTRELWVILRGRDEASRLVHSFARNVRDAGNAVRIAQLHAQAAAIRQQAQLLKTNGAVADQIRVMEQHVRGLDKQARAYTLAAAQAREHRDVVMRANGATNEQIAVINKHIRTLDRRAAVLRAQAALERNQIQTTVSGLNEQVRAMNTYAAALDSEARKLRDLDRVALNHTRTLQRMSIGFQQLSDVALGFTFALGGIAAASTVFMSSAVRSMVEYEKAVRLTATQVDGFKGDLDELADIGIRVGNEIGVSFNQIQPALFDIFSSMEVGVKDAEVLLNAFAKGAVAGQVEIQDVSRATIGLMNAFNLPIKDVNKLLDIQFQLVQEGVGTYEEWNQRIGLVTPSAVRAGQSVEMMAAALAVSTRMGLSAARSGTAVARAMDAMSHPTAVKNMEELGIKVRDAHGKMLPLNVVLRQFRDVLNKMPEKDRVKAILDVFRGAGGTIEARRFLQNMLLGKQNIELFDQVLSEMQNTSGSMEKAYSTMADSISVKTELLKNKWEILKIGVGQALVPSVLQLVDALSKALDWFNRLPDSTKNIITQFLLWGTAAAAVLAGMFAIVAVIGFVVAAFVTAGTTILIVIGVLAGLAAGAIAAGAAFITLWKNSEKFKNLIQGIGDLLSEAKDVVVGFAQDAAAAFNEKLRPALEDLWEVVDTKIIPVITDFAKRIEEKLIPKLKQAGEIFINQIKPTMEQVASFIKKDLIPALEDLAETYEKNKTVIDPFLQALGYLAIVAAIVAAAVIGGIVVPLRVLGFAIQLAAAWIDLLIKHIRELDDIARAAGNTFVTVWKTAIDFVIFYIQLMIKVSIAVLVTWPAKIRNAIYGIIATIAGVFVNAYTTAIGWTLKTIATVTGWFATLPARINGAILRLVANVASVFGRAYVTAIDWSSRLVGRVVMTLATLPLRVNRAIVGVISTVARVMAGAARSAFSGGADVVRSMVRGVTSLISWATGELRRAAGRIVQGFLDALPGSPVKWGPLKVLNNGKMGRKIIKMLLAGMDKETNSLRNAFGMVANPLLQPAVPSGYTPYNPDDGSSSAPMATKVVNNNITVNTQEINPRKQAADLAWELAGRM